MEIPLFQVDAFTDRPFAGNPAAVCFLSEDREDHWMQAVAAEMNLSETAFLLKQDDGYRLRWFTPKIEVKGSHRHEPVGVTRVRFRISLLCPLGRYRRRSSNRISPLLSWAVLAETAGQERIRGISGISPWWCGPCSGDGQADASGR